MTRIKGVRGRRVWDSRARPTVEAEVTLENGISCRAIAPSGASTGSGEAVDLRDGGERNQGYNVAKAVLNVNLEIAPALIGMDVVEQSAADRCMIELDGTPQKSRLGGNAMIAVSMAVLHAAAADAGLPLYAYLAKDNTISIPLPEIQIFGGGAHAGRRVDVQDFLIMCPSASSFAEALDWTSDVYHAAGKLMRDSGRMQGVADEGGWWPNFSSNEEVLDFLLRSIEAAGLVPGDEVHISLDIAASDFGRNGRYRLRADQRELDSDELGDLLMSWCSRYPILSIEDPFAEDDFKGFIFLKEAIGDRIQIIGDDLLVTNSKRISKASNQVNCVLIKPNQAGTITETIAALEAARACDIATIISARSGETEDTTIAHLAIGWNAGQFKVGSIARGERTAKWNEVLRMEESLSGKAIFAGWSGLPINSDSTKNVSAAGRLTRLPASG